ncbi:DUF3304 domain-containing protein [Ralstonia mannitolilytica]|uniref:DUF3304 domain-containing protein n=1 Tax=Ralstonia mannitolilytica TaxID=105219 RepID=A0AAD2EHC6_9RALS|nr:DUF3304 domain-containing protein [Ralstonia mannitolilytica]MBY4719644.1 DUF3304 domain-containing protein [Ralstonia mannitolilytica]CAJ0681953.1 hypothetical protein R77591_01592 [Ralstonia mannitolilytica]CAJ0866808.1 hypothetical protein R77569_01920 [Ralstonia mannitolilytica]
MNAKTMKRLCAVVLAGALLGLTACSKAEAPKVAASQEGDSLGGYVLILNYTDIPIGSVYVDGRYAGAMVANSGDVGTGLTSIDVPKHWDPNFKVTIKWSDDELYEKDKNALYVKEVPIEKYPPLDASFFYVAFYPNHEVKLYLTRYGPGAKDDPYHLEHPKDACLKRKAPQDRETCYAPEYRGEYRALQKQKELQKQQ